VASPSQFNRNMRRLGSNVAKNADALVRKCALAVDATVVLATPVDTGRARSNWQVELNAPAEGAREAYSPGKGRSTEGANTRAAIEQGKQVIATYNKGSSRDRSIHITNNLPYIGKLNDGHSAQAPAGFVEKAVMVGVNAIKGARITVGKVTE
jgi:hypothetical protein